MVADAYGTIVFKFPSEPARRAGTTGTLTRELMDKHTPDALVSGYERRIQGLGAADCNRAGHGHSRAMPASINLKPLSLRRFLRPFRHPGTRGRIRSPSSRLALCVSWSRSPPLPDGREPSNFIPAGSFRYKSKSVPNALTTHSSLPDSLHL